MIGLPPAAKIRGGTLDGPGPKRCRKGASSGRSMQAGGGMVTEDIPRWTRCLLDSAHSKGTCCAKSAHLDKTDLGIIFLLAAAR